ncbi:hypothetical protein G7072_07680 [Nocardioides sp. HDW12B]|uniref:hypothetical protein n=1 Tax=Nocardioides sp. HDW12B TaxID=2714939 RepID=UPI0014094D15|nr:hypothetical protein [Nocardioides sp. HDW12B]QIK66241.1 hypothetical protein G7072_07680 [Nocardioides sp. HDW12B]
MTAAVLSISLAGAITVGATRHGQLRGPSAPYDHSGFAEVSVATDDIVDGHASHVVAGLRSSGFWCVQARSNDRAVQIACQTPGIGADVDMIADTSGHVLYADIGLGPARSIDTARSRLDRVLDHSFLRLWPQDRAAVDQLIRDAQPTPGFFPLGGEAAPDADDQFSTHDERTANASWSLSTFYTGQPLALQIRTPDLRDRSWPRGGDHYATATSTAVAALRATGFTCASACYRARDGLQVRFTEHRDQIVAAHITLLSSATGNRTTDLSGQWIRDGIPFLECDVRTAIGLRIEECRVERKSWRGVVAGTPVEIRSVPGGLLPDGRAATGLEVSVGIPLVDVG